MLQFWEAGFFVCLAFLMELNSMLSKYEAVVAWTKYIYLEAMNRW